jgi:hypothetical protein
MKNLKTFVIVIFLMSPLLGLSQSKVLRRADFTLGQGSNVSTSSISFMQSHPVLFNGKLSLGYGLRLSGALNTGNDFITADAELAADEKTVDTFRLNSGFNAGLNIALYIEYLITKSLYAGFNIDAIGVGFGSSSNGTFTTSESGFVNEGTYAAKPSKLNLLLVGNNDIGYLKSEFYLGYKVKSNWGLRAGFDFTFIEFQTTKTLTFGNDRFRYKAPLVFVGFTFTPSNL